MPAQNQEDSSIDDDDIGADLYSGADQLDEEELVDPDDDEAGIDENLLTGSPGAEHQAVQQDSPDDSAPIPTFGAASGGRAFGAGFEPVGSYEGHGTHTGDAIARGRPGDYADEGKMFIGGLNWETDDDTLRTYFSQYGNITSSSIMRDPAGRSRGFAFLTFNDPASVNSVLAGQHVLDGKMIDPKRAVPRAEHLKSQKVFVGGLSPSVTNGLLKDFFSQYGQVMDAHIMLDRETSRSKGFAFVTFAEDADVQRAMSATGLVLEGKHIEVKRAQTRNTREGQFGDTGGHESSGGSTLQAGRFSHPGGFGQHNGNAGMPMSGPSVPVMGMGMPYGMPQMGPGPHMNPMMNRPMEASGAFDPQMMAVMYQRMMMMMNPAMGMMGGFSPENPMGAAAYGGGLFNPAMNPAVLAGQQMLGTHYQAGAAGRPPPPSPPAHPPSIPNNAPRGPAAMRNQPPVSGGPARNSSQGQARSRPY